MAANDASPVEARPIQTSRRGWQPVLTSKNLSIVVVGIFLITAILKADSKDVPKIVQYLFGSYAFATTGWVLAAVVLIAAIVVFKLSLRLHDAELKRIVEERDYLQSLLIKRSRE